MCVFFQTVATLPDSKCPGPKPSTTEICYAGLCDSVPKPETSTAVAQPDSPGEQEGFVEKDINFKVLASSMDLRSHYNSLNDGAGHDKKASYEWRDAGWTKCSETCLGGTQVH